MSLRAAVVEVLLTVLLAETHGLGLVKARK